MHRHVGRATTNPAKTGKSKAERAGRHLNTIMFAFLSPSRGEEVVLAHPRAVPSHMLTSLAFP